MKYRKFFISILIIFFTGSVAYGQAILAKRLSLEVNKQRLDNVLEIISNKGNFYFSYNSSIVNKDSLVSFKVINKTVKEILTMLFAANCEFKESGNYIIIRRAPIRMTLVTKKVVTEERVYSVKGYVYDEQSGAAINEASIYEKKMLTSALSNSEGFFKIKLKSSKSRIAELSISKEFYEDTTIKIEPSYNQQITITMVPVETENEYVVIKPGDYLIPDSGKKRIDTSIVINVPVSSDTLKVEKSGWGKLLLSGKQKVQSLNLDKFFTTRPFQVSITPWLGTHGKMSSQVVNNFSVNILGGYTAGTNGLEIGGLFNIDKKDVQYLQAAGLFNSVGGQVKGVQLAGINNLVLDSVRGLQAAGINNLVNSNMNGLQLAGIYNHVNGHVRGLQVAGVGNYSHKKTSGLQIAGVTNISNQEITGVQVAGVVNYTKKLKGVQVGLINIADSSDGYSIGLINVIIHGYHKLSFSANEISNVNAAFKTGNSKLYSILQAGLHAADSNHLYSFGYGLGAEWNLNKKKTFSINPELGAQYLYLGSWDYTNILSRFNLNLNCKLGKYFSFFVGPSFSFYLSDQKQGNNGYRFPIPPAGYNTIQFDKNMTGWFGWNAGINLF